MTLQEYLENRDIKEFADELQIHFTTVYRWLNGTRHPTPRHYKLIKKATNGEVTADSFYNDE